mmetsp:Transcript_46231/g.75427  ORF Transcript_46231/g.75427 Transcript_46231/m.75427 type:complete len:296 (+) Transcript_46231:152-1039(+)
MIHPDLKAMEGEQTSLNPREPSAPKGFGPRWKSAKEHPSEMLFASIFYFWVVIISLIMFPIFVIFYPFILVMDGDKRVFFDFLSSMWAQICCFPFVQFDIREPPKIGDFPDKVIYVSNHQSWLDIFAVLHLHRNVKFLARKDVVFKIPVIGWAVAMIGHVPVIQRSSESAHAALDAAKEYIGKGNSLFFFPEGKLSQDGRLRKFKTGAFRLAVETCVPIVPITVRDSGLVIPASRELNMRPCRTITMIIHDPIYVEENETFESLVKKTRAAIESELPEEAINGQYIDKNMEYIYE